MHQTSLPVVLDPVRAHTKSAVIVKNQLVLLNFSVLHSINLVLGRLHVRIKNLHMTSFTACYENAATNRGRRLFPLTLRACAAFVRGR